MKRKGDDDGGWGGRAGGGGGGGGWGSKTGKASSGRGNAKGKVLKAGTYGEAAGRTFAVLEVRGGRTADVCANVCVCVFC